MNDEHHLTKLDPRAYQVDALAHALDYDRATVSLPTGTGKTLVGCAWACRVLGTAAVDRVLVVEPSRFLVEQTTAYYNEHTTIPTTNLYGTTPRAERRAQWDEGVAVVTTPQTALHDLDWLDFDAVVVDECHHTTGQHAFAELMRAATFDRALGLSATVPPRSEATVEELVGPVRRWSYADLPDEHVPDWLGEVYDAPYPEQYRAVAAELDDYESVVLLGRLHDGTRAQERAVEAAKSDETDLVIATAAGEEGVDLPAADLLVVWSNVVSAVRFVQRLGRIMRQTSDRRLKHAVYLATPDSPDYDALGRGVQAASDAGLDITGIDGGTVLAEGVLGRVVDAVDTAPAQPDAVADRLSKPASTAERLLGEGVSEGHLCYLYACPEDLAEWRSAAPEHAKAFGVDPDAADLDGAMANTLSPRTEDRYYARVDDLPLLRAEYPALFGTDDAPRLSVSFGPSHAEQSAHSASGDPDAVAEQIRETLADAEQFYATVSVTSRRPTYSVQCSYHGPVSPAVVRAVCDNAAAVAQEVSARIAAD